MLPALPSPSWATWRPGASRQQSSGAKPASLERRGAPSSRWPPREEVATFPLPVDAWLKVTGPT
eukprot:14738497-Alexandrium_andersonii.AAC.1